MTASGCVVFDIDDTLYLERDYVRSGLRAVDRWVEDNFGLRDFFEHAWEAFDKGARGTIFDIVLSQNGFQVSPEVIETLVRVYRTHQPDIQLLPDARDCLDAMTGAFALAIVTDGPGQSQRAKVNALGTDRWIATTLLTAALGEGYTKPHPRAFRMIEAATGFTGERCVYVADNPAKDFAGPKKLGWRSVRIRRNGALHQDVANGSDVDLEIADLSELQLLLAPGAVWQWIS